MAGGEAVGGFAAPRFFALRVDKINAASGKVSVLPPDTAFPCDPLKGLMDDNAICVNRDQVCEMLASLGANGEESFDA